MLGTYVGIIFPCSLLSTSKTPEQVRKPGLTCQQTATLRTDRVDTKVYRGRLLGLLRGILQLIRKILHDLARL